MAKKQQPLAIDFKVLLLAGAVWFGYQYADKISIPTNLNVFSSTSTKEVTTAPSLDGIITDKKDAYTIAGLLEGAASNAEKSYKQGVSKTTIDLFDILKDSQNFQFEDKAVKDKYPKLFDVYDGYMKTPTKATDLTDDLVKQYANQNRELAKSARNAAL